MHSYYYSYKGEKNICIYLKYLCGVFSGKSAWGDYIYTIILMKFTGLDEL